MLVQYVGVEDVNELADKQFRAKSEALSLMTPYALVNGDMKQFKFTNDAAGCDVHGGVLRRRDHGRRGVPGEDARDFRSSGR